MTRLLIATVLLGLAACANPKTDGTFGIANSNAAFEAAFNGSDAATLATLYTVDAVVLAPNLARIDGRDGIQALWQNFFDAGITVIDLTSDELTFGDGAASELGRFTLKAPDGQGGVATLAGKYIVLWRLDADGVWRLHRDIWNNDPPG